MKLQSIGFYTLSDERAQQAGEHSPLWRCELILTGRCNFRCPYCKSVGGIDMPLDQAKNIVTMWAEQGLKNIRFSGGEPTMYKGLPDLVSLAHDLGIERIAVSTNGASSMALYDDLVDRGVNDFSISLDAANASDGDVLAGGRKGAFDRVVKTIRAMSEKVYVTVGVVLTGESKEKAEDTIRFADSLGVSDVRVIPAAQEGESLPELDLDDEILQKYPILKYRAEHLAAGISVRGISAGMTKKCGLVLDDMAVMGGYHYPCIIYMREGGDPIGAVGPEMRRQRAEWHDAHDSFSDPICAANCLDVCCDYNAAHERFNS